MRELNKIADEIRKLWTKPYFGAVPYIEAMRYLGDMSTSYGSDDAEYIVHAFLSNARGWRGEDARRIKAELVAMLPDRSTR
jgi:hypothetical protein